METRKQNLTHVFFIENEFEENILLQNDQLKFLTNNLFVTPKNINLKIINNYNNNLLKVLLMDSISALSVAKTWKKLYVERKRK